jgi:putative aminophosphonate oxidoreductase
MRSWWLRQALEREGEDAARATPPLAADTRADICIVGGGYTGLWTALRIKAQEPATDVVLIEGDICGGGASGRNGGFCMTLMSKASTVLKLCGRQEGVRLLRESEEAVRAIGAFCAEHGIDCHFRPQGWLWAATNEAQLGAWEGAVEDLDRAGLHPYELLSREEAQRRGGSEAHVAGVFEPGVATVQPALLARGLRRMALEKGVRIHEQTRMTGLARGIRPAVHTAGGTVTAGTVVLALNAWAHELPEFRRSVIPVAVDAIITEPVPDRLAEMGLPDGIAISDSRYLVNYYRTTVDGRMSFGKGDGAIPFAGRLGDRFDAPSRRGPELESRMAAYYPKLAGAGVAAVWRGPATRTATGLPFFGRLPGSPGIVYGHGYTGNGVGPSYLGGRILAALALGLDDEWSNAGLVVREVPSFVPVEPFRFLGAKMVRAACLSKEKNEDAGRPAGPLTATLASLAPAGLVSVRKKG